MLENVSLRMKKGEILGVVGEKRIGKDDARVSNNRSPGLRPRPPNHQRLHNVEEKNLLKLSLAELSKFRGLGIGMVFKNHLQR